MNSIERIQQRADEFDALNDISIDLDTMLAHLSAAVDDRTTLLTWVACARRELVANHMCPECMSLIEFVSHPAQGWACTDCPWTDDSLVWENVYETR